VLHLLQLKNKWIIHSYLLVFVLLSWFNQSGSLTGAYSFFLWAPFQVIILVSRKEKHFVSFVLDWTSIWVLHIYIYILFVTHELFSSKLNKFKGGTVNIVSLLLWFLVITNYQLTKQIYLHINGVNYIYYVNEVNSNIFKESIDSTVT
jgi:hypothetical protein